MRSIFFTIGSLAIVALCGCGKKDYSGPPNSFRRYPYNSFHLQYEISGDGRGTEDVYVAGYGKYEAQYSNTEIFGPQGVTSENHSLITKISDMYTLDNNRRNYIHRHLSSLDSLYHLDAGDVPTPAGNMENEMKQNLMRRAGSDTLQGKIAERWQLSDGNMTMWTWNSILLKKTAGTAQSGMTMVLKSFDTSWVVDSAKFQIPAGYQEVNSIERHASPAN